MPQPRGQKRIPGHSLVRVGGLAACECGWRPEPAWMPSKANAARTQHIVDIRMAAAE